MIAEAVFSFQGTKSMDKHLCPLWVLFVRFLKTVGVDWLEGPPVPIPNTEVKLKFVDDSMRATACENR